MNKSLECTFCNVHFQKFRLLRQHIVSVHGKKPHKCEKCEYSFAKMCDLKRLQRTAEHGHESSMELACKF